MEPGTIRQRLRRRIPPAAVLALSLASLTVSQAAFSIGRTGSPLETVLGGIVWLIVSSVVIAAGFTARNPIVAVDFVTGRVKIGRRELRIVDIDSAELRSTGPFQNPVIVLSLRARQGPRGSVYLRHSGRSTVDDVSQIRLVALVERSSLPDSVSRERGGTPLPGATRALTKTSAIALVIGELSTVSTRTEFSD